MFLNFLYHFTLLKRVKKVDFDLWCPIKLQFFPDLLVVNENWKVIYCNFLIDQLCNSTRYDSWKNGFTNHLAFNVNKYFYQCNISISYNKISYFHLYLDSHLHLICVWCLNGIWMYSRFAYILKYHYLKLLLFVGCICI